MDFVVLDQQILGVATTIWTSLWALKFCSLVVFVGTLLWNICSLLMPPWFWNSSLALAFLELLVYYIGYFTSLLDLLVFWKLDFLVLLRIFALDLLLKNLG